MSHVTVVDRKATADEVVSQVDAIRQLAADLGLSAPRLRRDVTMVVHSDEAGYRAVTRPSAAASELVGA